jgi:Tfp pilus assembly protein PilN
MVMKTMDIIRLNLATRPLRNKRFYRIAFAASVLVLAGLTALAGFLSVKYGLAHRKARAEVSELEARIARAGAETSSFLSVAAAAAKSDKEKIDVVNAVIMRKSFSWTALLSELEGALPESSYITSLAPNFAGESAVDLRIRVVSRNLNDLLALVDRLTERKFTRIRVDGESTDERGQIASEITFSYERAL